MQQSHVLNGFELAAFIAREGAEWQHGAMREPLEPGPPLDLKGIALYCLIDADNFFASSATEPEIRHLLMQLIESCQRRFGGFERVHLRLYGGWMAAGALTQRASQVAQLVSAAFPLPMALPDRTVLRGDWELAHSLLSNPSIRFEDTWRRRASVPRLRLAKSPQPDGCVSGGPQCPAAILRHITRAGSKTCPVVGCGVRSDEMFLTAEQKQVDTMMTADLLDIARLEQNRVVCVSDDTDFVPGLVAASHASSRVGYCNLDHSYDQDTRSTLATLQIQQVSLPKARQ
ncbi:hypothetical protein SAMN06266982_1265 [Propioniciclava tarda]|nr:hypothetical protein SAMN06266982_1265 [Propioniciclava tarda]